MSDPSENPENRGLFSQSAARRLVRSDAFWIGIALFMMVLGLVEKFGIPWALSVGLAGTAFIAIYGHLPAIKEKKHLAWEAGRAGLLEKWSLVVAKLGKSSRERYNRLHLVVARLGDLTPRPRRGSLLRPGEYLLWLYLKLLMARDLLEEGTSTSSEATIEEQRTCILQELEEPGLTSASRQSKEETILILDQRLDTARNRWSRLDEIESDLTRIEQKLSLMFDRAAQHNTMGDSGRRINFSDEIQTGISLASPTSSHVEELDNFVTAQVCA
jgi:hypothetical protein